MTKRSEQYKSLSFSFSMKKPRQSYPPRFLGKVRLLCQLDTVHGVALSAID